MFGKFIKILLMLSGIFVASNSAEEAVDCSNSELVTIVFNEPIDLTHNGDIRIYSDVIINNLISITNNDFEKNYIDARLEEQSNNSTKSLIIFTTEHFANYAMEQAANRITLRVIFGCDSGRQRTLIFYQPFNEGNYFRPEFSQALYEFTLPMPLFAGFDLTTFGVISAKDHDLTGNEINFSSDEAGIYFIGVGTDPEIGEDRKTYFAQLTLERIYLALATEIQFNITATDSGNPPLNSSATVIMRADPANTLPATPHFEQLVYHAALNESLQMLPFIVTLKIETYNADVGFEKFGTDQHLFEIRNTSNVLEVRLAAELQETDVQNKKYLEFEIKADNQKLTEFGQTAVIVAIPNAKESSFTQSLYDGNLTTQNEELLHEVIIFEIPEQDWPKLSFQLDEERMKYFDVNQTGNNVQLKLKAGVDKRVWLDHENLVLELYALLNGNTQIATTNILIEIIKRRFHFEHPLYNGTIDTDGNMILENILLQVSDDTIDNINYTLAGPHAELFEVQRLESNELQVKLKSTVTGQEWQNENYLTTTLQAADELWSTTTLILIQLQQNSTTGISKGNFRKPLYQGEVNAKSNSLVIENIIYDSEDNNKTTLTFALNSIGQQYFIVDQQENVALLKVRPDLELSQWKGLDNLQAQLFALVDDAHKATAELLFHVKQRWVRFDNSIYNGSLDARNTLNLTKITFESNDNSTDGIVVKLTGTHAESFHVEHLTVNVVVVKLNDGVSVEQWVDLKFVSLNIVAQDDLITATSLILLEITQWQLKESFRFVSPLYEGNIEENGALTISAILFNEAAYDPAIDFQLHGTEQQLFHMEKQLNRILLKLSEEFNLENWKNLSYFALEISATLIDQHDTTAVFIKLPQSTTKVEELQPVFESPLYFGTLTADGELTTDTMQLKETTYIANKTEFHLVEQEPKDLFEIVVREHFIKLQLKREPSEEEIASNFVFSLVLAATNDDLQGFASIVIKPPTLGSTNVGDIFLHSWHSGKIEFRDDDANATNAQVLQMSVIPLRNDHKVDDFAYTLEGTESRYFSTSADAERNVINLQLAEPIPDATLQTKSQLNLILHGVKSADNAINGSTFIFVELPKQECPDIPTVAPPTDVPTFDNDHYIFAAKPNQLGSIGNVNANVENSGAAIKYTLNVENEHLAPRISINVNTGELQLLSYVSPGVYHFEIWAQNAETLSKSDVSARLDVDSLIQCNDGQTNVANTLIIKYIEEEKVHTDIMPMSLEDCEYQIFSMFPDDKAYVSIDENTKMLTSIKIDREDVIFGNMTKPQVEVKLKLHCKNALNTTERKRRDIAIDDYSLILSQDIPYTRDVTVLHLILIDVNDNAPQFIYPAKPTHIGYPESKICLELFPEYLTQVHAFDIDEGLNAKIRYSLRSEEHFAIDSETGVIYPTANALQLVDSITLYVKATDRDGATDGLSTEAELFVKRLSADYFTLLTLRSSDESQDLNEQLQALAKTTNYQINSVKTATIPGSVTDSIGRSLVLHSRRRRAATDGTVIQKVWIYALDADAPVTSEQFKQRLSSLPSTENIFNSVETYKEVGLMSNQTINWEPIELEQNVTGYIAAISVLSVALFLLLCFILWHFYLAKIYQRRRKSALKKFENETTTPSTPVVETKLNSYNGTGYVRRQCFSEIPVPKSPESSERRHSVDFSDITLQDAIQQFTQPSTDTKSGVKFNELVERIHIVDVDGSANVHSKEEQSAANEVETERL